MVPAMLDLHEPFTFEATLAFDVHISDMNLELVMFDRDMLESD